MRVKPGRVKHAPLSPLPGCHPSPRNTNSYSFKADPEKSVQELVERRVRSSLKLVQQGDITPGQALRAVVNCLADELTTSQYLHLVAYFQAKETKGQLAPAKQLLLKHLTAAKACLPADTRDQQQQTTYSNKATTAAPASKKAVGVIVDTTNTRGNSDQAFCSSSQSELWDTAKQQQFLQTHQQQQVCGIKPAAPWSSVGFSGLQPIDW